MRESLRLLENFIALPARYTRGMAPRLHRPSAPALVCLGLLAALAGSSAAEATPKPTRVTLGAHGELIVDGKPRFVRAGYRSGQEDKFTSALASASAAGFDIVHDYRFESFDIGKRGPDEFIREAKAYLRRARELGLGVFLGLPRAAVRAGDEAAVSTLVKALRGEPALWMWYVYDEPRPDVLPVESATRIHALLRRLDPGHPSILLSNRDDTARDYHSACDVLWLDRYPITATREPTSVMPIALALQNARAFAGPEKPLWAVIQAFDNRGNPNLRKKTKAMATPDNHNYRPTEREVRAQAHAAIARGAMGVAFYWAPESWYSMKTDTPAAWASLTRVLGELGSLEPVLLDNGATPVIEVRGGKEGVLTWTRVHDGATYVGIVNTDTRKGTQVGVRAPGLGRDFGRVLGDGVVEAVGGGVEVRLEPAGVAVFSFRAR